MQERSESSSGNSSNADFSSYAKDFKACSIKESVDPANVERKRLEFKNPGRFMENFDPERSGREMRKMTKRMCPENKKACMYTDCGLLIVNDRDLCDCLDVDCTGCHFPCAKCGSGKCGGECRCNRRWIYQEIEIEGSGEKVLFPSDCLN